MSANEAVGNAAAMREALANLVDVIDRYDGSPLWWHCGAKGVKPLKDAKAALASPPRNCDRYSHDEALSVWAAEKENGKNGCFDEWLYAPATEQKGETDGK